MRCMMKVSIPVERGNEAAKNGTLNQTIEAILTELKPETAHFCDWDGKRTGFIVFDLKDPSQIPAVAEPWFLALEASLEFHPCMNLDDLKKAAPGMEKAVKNYRELKRAA
jgi:Domain of unknown function (DUF3303)